MKAACFCCGSPAFATFKLEVTVGPTRLKVIELSRSEICEACGIDKGSLSRFVSGERGLELVAIDKLAELLGLRITTSKRKGK